MYRCLYVYTGQPPDEWQTTQAETLDTVLEKLRRLSMRRPIAKAVIYRK
ncbi:hypothetical protein KEJ33_03370 [Candidatus Bathyarchaeota archaeon]|nr:hypothetical protein [Candidatus Bathyarchaeota archaeon]